jgi:hypothetical protein
MAELMLPNLLGAYNQGIETRRQNALMLQKQQQAQMQEAQALAIQNELARSDDPYSADVMNRLSRMPGGLDVVEKLAKAQEARGKGMQESTKGIEGRMQYWKRLIPADPRLAPNWVRSAYNDPVVGPELEKLGTADEVIASLPQDPNQYMKWVEGASMFADEVAKRRTPSAESMLPYTQPLSEEVLNQKMLLEGAKRPVSTTNIINQSESERAKTLGKLSGEDVIARYKNVQSSARGLQKSNEALALLKEGKPITGLAADLNLGISRLQKAVAGRSDKSISDTELLEAVLGQDVFQQIQQLGIGARGLDTPAEREFLRSVVSGTKTLDKQTLIKMAEARRNAQEDIIRSWNEDTKSGDLDSFYRDTGYRKKEFPLPERAKEARQLSPQDQEALDWANSNPRDPRSKKIKDRIEGK